MSHDPTRTANFAGDDLILNGIIGRLVDANRHDPYLRMPNPDKPGGTYIHSVGIVPGNPNAIRIGAKKYAVSIKELKD